jgi:hypothetical protein
VLSLLRLPGSCSMSVLKKGFLSQDNPSAGSCPHTTSSGEDACILPYVAEICIFCNTAEEHFEFFITTLIAIWQSLDKLTIYCDCVVLGNIMRNKGKLLSYGAVLERQTSTSCKGSSRRYSEQWQMPHSMCLMTHSIKTLATQSSMTSLKSVVTNIIID